MGLDDQVMKSKCSHWITLDFYKEIMSWNFFTLSAQMITVDIQRRQDRICHGLVSGGKADLFLIKVGKSKLLSSGTNTKLYNRE